LTTSLACLGEEQLAFDLEDLRSTVPSNKSRPAASKVAGLSFFTPTSLNRTMPVLVIEKCGHVPQLAKSAEFNAGLLKFLAGSASK
jgi:pimeloyl-ACP methyl ester carboxylesterase